MSVQITGAKCTGPVHFICGSSVWYLLPFTLLAPTILKLFTKFWKICQSLIFAVISILVQKAQSERSVMLNTTVPNYRMRRVLTPYAHTPYVKIRQNSHMASGFDLGYPLCLTHTP
jgi:hypothetical protein